MMAITGQAALRSPLSGRTSPRAVFQLTKALNRSVVQSTLMAEMRMPASGPVARCSHTLPFRPALVIRPTKAILADALPHLEEIAVAPFTDTAA